VRRRICEGNDWASSHCETTAMGEDGGARSSFSCSFWCCWPWWLSGALGSKVPGAFAFSSQRRQVKTHTNNFSFLAQRLPNLARISIAIVYHRPGDKKQTLNLP
jgi:hypothetical protein